MEGNLIGEPIDIFVQNQIDIRQQNQFSGYNSLRNDDQLKYLSNRNAWIKLASSVNILADGRTPSTPEESVAQRYGLEFTGVTTPLGESKLRNIGFSENETKNYLDTKLAEKAILFNSISEYIPINSTGGTLNNKRAGIPNTNSLWNDTFAYGIGGTDFGIQPPPGIIGATVDSLNRGSIRKANITLKAHNKFQFDIIEILYLRLGFTMMLEWGWDKFLNDKGTLQQTGNTIIEEKWFTSNGVTQLEMLGFIQNKRKEYNGNYDGFFGKVSNFTWSFNSNGSYDISIDLITLGDVIESIKVNTSLKEFFGLEGANAVPTIEFKEGSKLFNTNIAKASTLNTLGYFLFDKIRELTQQFTTSNSKFSNGNYIIFNTSNDSSFKSPQYYIRLSEFLTQLETKIIPKIKNNSQNTFSQLTFEKLGVLISYFPNQISLDPRVCIFKPTLNSYGDITGVTQPLYFNEVYFADYIYSKDNHTYGLLMNLYINFEFLAGLLTSNGGPDQELFLFKFLQDLCNGINSALGGVNKLEPIIKDDNKITIIDQTLSIPEIKDTVNLEVYGYNPKSQISNFVKDIKFVSKIVPQLASMISIGATAAGSSTSEIDGTAFSKFSEGLVDRFSKEILEPKGISEELKQQTELEQRNKYKERFIKFHSADQSFRNLFKEASESVDAFNARVNLLGYQVAGYLNLLSSAYAKEMEDKARIDLINAELKDNDVGEIRIVNEDGLELKAMSFEEYYSKAVTNDINKKLDGTYEIGEINELTSTNYGVYLLKAFGGTSNNVKIEFFGTTPNQIITGLGSQMSFTNNTKTVENLQVTSKKARYLEFDEVFISQGKSAYKTYINTLNNNRYKTDNIPSSEIGFIPLSFELVLDGISGVKIYNKLKINNKFLPSNYPESLSFIITKVNHNISNNSWETSLSTISMPRTEPYKYESVPTQTNNGVDNFASTFRFDPKTLTTSEKGIKFIKDKEKFIGRAYDDKNPKTILTATTRIEGTLTVGYGFTNAVGKYFIKPIAWNTVITQDVADTIFNNILKGEYEKSIQNSITAPLTQYEFDALVSIVYNSGGLSDPLKKAINDKNYDIAANLIPTYKATQGGIPNVGLKARRAKEQQVFISGNYGS